IMSDEQREINEPVPVENVESNEGEMQNLANEIEEEEASFSEIQKYEDEARRLLAAQDENSCTYAEGYKPRQALYSCRTCVPTGGAGVCFGCSMNCHDGHDLVELYTKRRFKCDCGNASFKEKCKLFENKNEHNERNEYNGNFVNEYCTCKRPYPDPEATTHEELMQCVVCEDWLHITHTGLLDISRDDFAQNEFACKSCCEKLPFLAKVDRGVDADAPMTCSKEKKEESDSVSAHLLMSGWREKLCACAKCEDLYDKLKCDWIHDPEDSLDRYNEIAECRMKEEDDEKEKELTKFMQNQDKNVVINVLSEVNKMKRKMNEYLERIGENAGVITTDHIRELFDELKRDRQTEFNQRMEELSEGKKTDEDDEMRVEEGEH
ncbi:hypothetical protein PFISCL1PPCAC_19720, partial [Pristionchus fissidentatus]